ncbi:MAG: type II secretion system protein GspM [Candidatus Binatia bacterium]
MKQFWQRLSQRERGLVFLTGAIVLFFVGKVAIATPLLERRATTKGQLESQPQLLQKNLRYLSQKDSLLAALAAARNQIKSIEPALLTGDTPSVTASDLQETVQSLATREGTQVITTRVLNPEPSGSFSKIAIQMEIGGQVQQLASLIRGIESAPKLLVIDEINVRSLFRPVGFPQVPGAQPAAQQNLRVSLTVVGFARAQPAPAAKPGAPSSPAKAAPDKPV